MFCWRSSCPVICTNWGICMQIEVTIRHGIKAVQILLMMMMMVLLLLDGFCARWWDGWGESDTYDIGDGLRGALTSKLGNLFSGLHQLHEEHGWAWRHLCRFPTMKMRRVSNFSYAKWIEFVLLGVASKTSTSMYFVVNHARTTPTSEEATN